MIKKIKIKYQNDSKTTKILKKTYTNFDVKISTTYTNFITSRA